MNVRLQYVTAFNAGFWLEQQLVMSTYQIRIKLLTQTLDPADQNIALERVKHFLLSEIHSTVFVNQTEVECAEAFASLGLNVTTLPEDPVDQIVGIMLYHKLNAIMQGRMKVSELVLSSDAGDNVEFYHSQAEQTNLFAGPGWWNDATTLHDNIDDDTAEISDVDTVWRELDLGWNGTEIATDVTQVVFANFDYNDTKH
jgi:hypothetical protein